MYAAEIRERMSADRGPLYHDAEQSAIEYLRDTFGDCACGEPGDDFVHNTARCEFLPMQVPTKNALCDGCDGEGKAFGGGGIAMTMSEFHETFDDEDSREGYFRGDYDSACRDCGGAKVVKVIDRDRLTPEQREAYDEALEDARASNAETLAEYRMGC